MRFLKVSGVVFGTLIITTLGISASDVLTGSGGSLLGQVIGTTQDDGCPQGMVSVAVGQTFSCVDIYEASPNVECSIKEPSNSIDTQTNINTTKCAAQSTPDKRPWTNITREQAQVVCMRAGKRLPTAKEWYIFALGTADTSECNIDANGAGKTGSFSGCVSATGVFDTIGNVWEWVSDDVIDGRYNGRMLPQEGYVAQVASDGIATVSESTPVEQFESDYIWTKQSGAFGILRGGFYGSGDDAGVYAVQVKTPPTAATVAIGFRCVL